MIYDLYAELAAQKACPTGGQLPEGLVSGFVDGCTAWSTRGDDQKNEGRRCYMRRAQAGELKLPCCLSRLLTPNLSTPLEAAWLGLEVLFELETPWYSKDDRPFHVLDNPVRKDRVFRVPYMAAASWKGMLRWACRMQAGLGEHLEKTKGKFEGWEEPLWILHFFGNEKGEEQNFHRGALVFYPTWFDRIGFEVINPHSRKTKAGTQPIYYEVVPSGATGKLYLLYAPWPGMEEPVSFSRRDAIVKLLDAVERLLTTYGISAKRTVGWGTAKIETWKAYRKGEEPAEATSRGELWNRVQIWFEPHSTS